MLEGWISPGLNSASSASLLRSMAKRQLFGFLTLAASVLAQDRFKKHAERSADSLVRTNISLVAKTRGQGCPRSVLESALVLALLIFTPATNAKTSASAGWAEVDITPPLGIGLGGRGGPGTVAKKVLDPLFAQVLYLQDAHGAGFVLVSFDVVALPHDLSDRLRFAIVNELGVDWNLVLLNASHTHSGPYTIRSLIAGVGPAPKIEQDYLASLEEKIVSATRAAAK